MGLLSALLGNASEADVEEVERTLDTIQRTFTQGQAILDVQKAFATHVGR
jgi:hypothetical protein